MGLRYAITGQEAAVGASEATALGVSSAGAGNIVSVYEIMMSASGALADESIKWEAQRMTAAGTSTSVTPAPLNFGLNVTAEAAAGENHTVEPTYATESIIVLGLHVRSVYRWVASPGGELISTNSAGSGFGVTTAQASGAYAGTAEATLHFEE